MNRSKKYRSFPGFFSDCRYPPDKPAMIATYSQPPRIALVWGSSRYLAEAIRLQGPPKLISLPPVGKFKWRVREQIKKALQREYPSAVIETTVFPTDVHVVYSWERTDVDGFHGGTGQ